MGGISVGVVQDLFGVFSGDDIQEVGAGIVVIGVLVAVLGTRKAVPHLIVGIGDGPVNARGRNEAVEEIIIAEHCRLDSYFLMVPISRNSTILPHLKNESNRFIYLSKALEDVSLFVS